MEFLLATIASVQCGVFSRAQALAAGYTDKRIKYLLAMGIWLRCHPGIYRVAGVELSLDMSAWIAVLAAGRDALLSHRFAGKVHTLEGTPPPVRFDVSVPDARHPRNVPRATIHRTDLAPEDIATCRGLPVTSVARTVVDLARTLPMEIGSTVIADALRTERVSVAALEQTIGRLARRIGIERARHALANADPRVESVLERELFAPLRRAGLNPVAQYVVTAGGRFVARVDFALPGIRRAIECDGYDTRAAPWLRTRPRESCAVTAARKGRPTPGRRGAPSLLIDRGRSAQEHRLRKRIAG